MVTTYQLNMHSHAWEEDFQLSDIKRPATWQSRSLHKCAMMYALNQNYSRWPVNLWQVQPWNLSMVHSLISQQTEYGVERLKDLLWCEGLQPLCSIKQNMSLQACYRKHKQEKKHAYEQRTREIMHSTFTPLVLLATGSMGKEATVFFKHLAFMLV